MQHSSHVNYQSIENELSREVQHDLTERLKKRHYGSGGGVQALVSKLVVAGEYPRAVEELTGYVNSKDDYKDFQERCKSNVKHCLEIIATIENKRNLPGLGSLSLSKRQELADRVETHFDELKQQLKQIEKLERDARIADSRSTVWVIQIFWQAVLGIFIVAFIMDMNVKMLYSFQVILGQFGDQVSTMLLNLLGL